MAAGILLSKIHISGHGLLVIQISHLELHQNCITLDDIGQKRLRPGTYQRTDIHMPLTDISAYR